MKKEQEEEKKTLCREDERGKISGASSVGNFNSLECSFSTIFFGGENFLLIFSDAAVGVDEHKILLSDMCKYAERCAFYMRISHKYFLINFLFLIFRQVSNSTSHLRNLQTRTCALSWLFSPFYVCVQLKIQKYVTWELCELSFSLSRKKTPFALKMMKIWRGWRSKIV